MVAWLKLLVYFKAALLYYECVVIGLYITVTLKAFKGDI